MQPLAPPTPAALGASLRRWRRLRGMKQTHLADLLRVSQGTISRWESGRLTPDPADAARIGDLLAARPDSAADRALADLVRQAGRPVHLICDLTHALLAASPGREAEWRIALSELAGRSLFRFASPEIAAAEARLADTGWYASPCSELRLETGPNRSEEVPIPAGAVRWTRMPLSDGGFARLVRSA